MVRHQADADGDGTIVYLARVLAQAYRNGHREGFVISCINFDVVIDASLWRRS